MRYLIHRPYIINKGQISKASLLIENELIIDIFTEEVPASVIENTKVISADGLYLLPGIIDDQVHFREPGMTYKGDIESESRAAIAGGITSYMEMPNTKPATTDIGAIEDKLKRASEVSWANYSFYIGATNDNYKEICAADPSMIAGIKIFLGSSTGNMLVDNEDSLNYIFEHAKVPVAVHSEDENIIRRNMQEAVKEYENDIPSSLHAEIRSHEACVSSTLRAIARARKYGTRLHVLHLSTAEEALMFAKLSPDKHITAEVCVHHLWFSSKDYAEKGNLIKWNPSIKNYADREELRKALTEGRIDIVATDHAPHTLEEKEKVYTECPSGGPLVQHSLPAMLDMYHQGIFSLETIVDKMCHAPARIFGVKKRGFIEKGYFADLVLVDLNKPWTVTKDNILYKCGWSPFEEHQFRSSVVSTFVNGTPVFLNGAFTGLRNSMKL